MDRREGERRNVVIIAPVEEIDIELQVEPWAWGAKDIPATVARRMQLYREFLENERNKAGDDDNR
jgi:hypothetical protein